MKLARIDARILLLSTYITKLRTILPPSSQVDYLLFLLGIKSCVRTKLINPSIDLSPLKKWAVTTDLCYEIDAYGFVYLAPSAAILDQLMQLDQSDTPHEEKLGILLGYPRCCGKKIASIGEKNIDLYEKQLVTQHFPKPFHVINPASYRKGSAFISHVPCCPTCIPSLEQAEKVLAFVKENRDRNELTPWIKEIERW